jgi:acetyl esterase/lipase
MKGVLKRWVVILLLLGTLGITARGVEASVIAAGEVERDVPYCDGDVSLKMDIYHPATTETPAPAIVYVHGGGWYSGDKSNSDGQEYIRLLAARGYLVAAVNYRLAPRYQFPAQIEDIKCAVRFLRANAAKYNIDPTNIGALGDSAGGHLVALLGMTDGDSVFGESGAYCQQSDQVQAVVDLYGPADLELFFESNASSLLAEHVFGTDDPDSEIVKEASPVTYVSGDAPPFLIIQGDKDDIVSPQQSQELYERLISAGAPASLIMVKNAGHSFAPVAGDITPTRKEIARLIGDFFDKQLRHPEPAVYR